MTRAVIGKKYCDDLAMRKQECDLKKNQKFSEELPNLLP